MQAVPPEKCTNEVVALTSGAPTGNRIGVNPADVGAAAERNVISGNTGEGVLLSGTGVSGNTVAGNYIGLNKNGTGTAVDQSLLINQGFMAQFGAGAGIAFVFTSPQSPTSPARCVVLDPSGRPKVSQDGNGDPSDGC